MMIYDCIPFFNELEMLELRLNELDNVVDRFVIVESTLTHQGNKKRLYFEENKSLFKKFEHKIIHVVVDDMPNESETTSWTRENFQRNAIWRGLIDCKSDDVIMVSDTDELPNPTKVVEAATLKGIRIFFHRPFGYFFNCAHQSQLTYSNCYTWPGTFMINFGNLYPPVEQYRSLTVRFQKHYQLHPLRRKARKLLLCEFKGKRVTFIDQAGWHFTYLGGVERIIQKLEAFSHAEFNTSYYKDPERIISALKNGNSIFGDSTKMVLIPIDETFPRYLNNNIARFSAFIANWQS